MSANNQIIARSGVEAEALMHVESAADLRRPSAAALAELSIGGKNAIPVDNHNDSRDAFDVCCCSATLAASVTQPGETVGVGEGAPLPEGVYSQEPPRQQLRVCDFLTPVVARFLLARPMWRSRSPGPVIILVHVRGEVGLQGERTKVVT
jgi:hypothetical protein